MEENEVLESEELENGVDESEDELLDDEEEIEDGEDTTDGEDADEDPFESYYEDEESDEDDDGAEGDSADDGGRDEKYDALSGKVKQTLEKLGYKGEGDPEELLDRLSAEADGVSPEEFDRRRAWEAQAAKDIEAIHAAYPETVKYKSLSELPNKMQFARFMDDKKAGLNAVQAFSASHPDIVAAHVAGAARKSNLAGTKNHLKSSIPKGANDTGVKLSRAEMEGYREMFPDLSDKEIKELYRKTN